MPSQARSRTGSSVDPQDGAQAAASRSATVVSLASSAPPRDRWHPSCDRSSASLSGSSRATYSGRAPSWSSSTSATEVIRCTAKVLFSPRPLVVALQEAADQRHRPDHPLAAAALGVDVAEPDRQARR